MQTANSKITSSVADGSRKIAIRFIDRFGFRDIKIDEFDTFIIDEKLATDPETSDPKDIRYRQFVTERSAAKRKLNAAGPYLNGQSYQVIVETPGLTYTVTPWISNSKDIASNMGRRVRKFTDSRFGELRKLHNKAESVLGALDASEPSTAAYRKELLEGVAMLGFMRQQAIELQSRVKGLVTQYNTAADAVEEHVKQLTSHFESAGALTDQSEAPESDDLS